MNLLAFEASTHRLSVALWCDGVLTEKHAMVPNSGSERLLPWANDLLTEAGMNIRQLGGIAFGAGPGGFTGLRLACGLAQGLAFGLDVPVVPVCTLAALALECGAGRVIACLDARMNEVYVAAYEVAGSSVAVVLAPQVGAGETVALPEGTGWHGVGDGFATWGAVLRTRMAERLTGDDPALCPTAAAVARLAAPALLRGNGMPAAQAVPLYVRDKVALTTVERLARGGAK